LKLNKEFAELAVFSSIMLLIALVFSYILFGITGIRVALGIIFISLPFYLVLNNFGLAEGEKLVFSILLGLTIFPSLAYFLGLVVPFRIAIASVFVLLIAIWLLLRKYKSK
jgi:hypothetical protein